MTRFICVTSGKGGVGKTTTAVNLAGHFNKQDHNAVLVDGNISTPHVHLHLGNNDVEENLHHAIQGRKHASELVYRHVSGLRVIPAMTALDHLKFPDYEGLKHSLLDMDGYADIVVIDTAPGFSRESVVPMEVADEVVIVTTPEDASLEDAKRSMEVASELGKTISGVVVNMIRDDRFENIERKVEEKLGLPVIGQVPHDASVEESWKMKHPVVHTHPQSRASRSFQEVAEGLLQNI